MNTQSLDPFAQAGEFYTEPVDPRAMQALETAAKAIGQDIVVMTWPEQHPDHDALAQTWYTVARVLKAHGAANLGKDRKVTTRRVRGEGRWVCYVRVDRQKAQDTATAKENQS